MSDGMSCYNGGASYSNGDGVEKNLKNATQYYKKGCDLKFGDACAYLSFLYFSMEKNDKKAFEYAKKGCNLAVERLVLRLGLFIRLVILSHTISKKLNFTTKKAVNLGV